MLYCRQRSIEDALLACGQFDEALSSLREWLEKSLPQLQNVQITPVYGDLETVSKLCDKHKELREQIDAHRDTLNSIKERAQQVSIEIFLHYILLCSFFCTI